MQATLAVLLICGLPLLLLPYLAVPVTGLRDVFRLPEQHMRTTGTAAYWLAVYGLPVVWLALLWLGWGLSFARSKINQE